MTIRDKDLEAATAALVEALRDDKVAMKSIAHVDAEYLSDACLDGWFDLRAAMKAALERYEEEKAR